MPCQYCNVVEGVLYFLHNQPRRTGYEEIPRDTCRRGTRSASLMKKIDRVKKRFVEEGLDVALHGRKGSRIYAKKVDGDFEAHLVAVSCTEPPAGFAKWSLRLLADTVVELDYIDSVSHETVRRILKKRTQALAAKRVGNSAGAKRQFCCQHGKSAGRLQSSL